VVLSVFALSLGPFAVLGQLPLLLRRLFPFQRGLLHAYWAPNAWALYAAADRAIAFAARKAGWISLLKQARPLLEGSGPSASATGGLVGETAFAVLPSVSPAITALLVLLLQVPNNSMHK